MYEKHVHKFNLVTQSLTKNNVISSQGINPMHPKARWRQYHVEMCHPCPEGGVREGAKCSPCAAGNVSTVPLGAT
eukprot:1397304-Amphidinium_carterae.1